MRKRISRLPIEGNPLYAYEKKKYTSSQKLISKTMPKSYNLIHPKNPSTKLKNPSSNEQGS